MRKTKYLEQLVESVVNDFNSRREQRRNLESQWQLNINFMIGNQYSYIGNNGNIFDSDKQYFWQEREVFNHIASNIEARICRIIDKIPTLSVLPASNDIADIESARLSKEILASVTDSIDLKDIVRHAVTWSEITGTAFYKISWNADKGTNIRISDTEKSVKIGDIDVTVCSPFEVLPDNLNIENISECKSIIHARAYNVDDIKTIWGKSVKPEKVRAFTFDNISTSLGGLGYNAHINKVANVELQNSALIIERYELPSEEFPNGRLTIVCSNELLYDGELPYINAENGERTFPFVKQISNFMTGSFYGVSVIDRMIPIQRAYNAVRNRKHEYLNRISMGVLTVEDGSVDTDALEVDGLSPGKVLVYRQGGKAPEIMEVPEMIGDFATEEDRLLEEFKNVSGISDLVETYNKYSNLSGTALELIYEQNELRLSMSISELKKSVKLIGKQILNLYKQFAVVPRLLKIAGTEGTLKMYYWDNTEICSDDVVIETQSDLGDSITTRRATLMELINSGLLYDKNGTFSESMRRKCLDMIGFGSIETTQDINALHINKAKEENLKLSNGDSVQILEIDDHQIHIDEHTAHILSQEFRANASDYTIEKFLLHIREHKKLLKGDN